MRETWVRSLGQEDLLEKELATRSSILAWRIPWMEELGAAYCPWGPQRVGPTERLPFPFTQPTYTVLGDKEAFAILKACLGATSSGLPLVCKIVSTFGKGALFAMIE